MEKTQEEIEKEKAISVEMVLVGAKDNTPILDANGKKIVEKMSLYKAKRYFFALNKQKPTQSRYMPDENSGYIYDKATNSLIKNEPVTPPVVETVLKKAATKPTEPTV